MDELYFYDCNLNIKSFAGMLENPTQCYKFFWLDSISSWWQEEKMSLHFWKFLRA